MADSDNSGKQDHIEADSNLSFWELLKSTSSAFLGVQSNANRQRDFTRGKPSHFILMGLMFGLLFVLTIVGVVQLVLHFTGS